MKLLIATVLLVATNALANPADMPTMSNQASEASTQNVVGMQGAIKISKVVGLFKTQTTVTEMASGCSFQAKVVLGLSTLDWKVVEKAGSNTCN